MGTYPIGGHFVGLEPESSLCGFEITADYSGSANFQVTFDESGEPIRIHVHAAWSGTISANGITLRSRSSLNQFFDLDDSTVVEVGLVFQNAGPHPREGGRGPPAAEGSYLTVLCQPGSRPQPAPLACFAASPPCRPCGGG